jgi:hypothetical protein
MASYALRRLPMGPLPEPIGSRAVVAVSPCGRFVAVSDGTSSASVFESGYRRAEVAGRVELCDGEGSISALAFISTASGTSAKSKAASSPILGIGTSTGCLLLATIQGVVLSVAEIDKASAVVTIDVPGTVPRHNPAVSHTSFTGILIACASGVCLFVPSGAFSAVPDVPSTAPRPKATDVSRKSSDGVPVVVQGWHTWCKGGTAGAAELWALRAADGHSRVSISSARLFLSRSCPKILDILAPSVATERRVVVVGQHPFFATYLIVKEEGAKSAGQLVAAVAGHLTDAAVGMFRGFLSGTPSATTRPSAARKAVQSAFTLPGTTLTSLMVDPSHRFASAVDPGRNRVILFDLVSASVHRILKGCRSASITWIPNFNSALLGVQLGLRGIVEVYGMASGQRLTAAGCVSGSRLHAVGSNFRLLSPAGEITEYSVSLAAADLHDQDESHLNMVPQIFRGTVDDLTTLLEVALGRAKNAADALRLVHSVPQNLSAEHLMAAYETVLRFLTSQSDTLNSTTALTVDDIEGRRPVSYSQARHYVELKSQLIHGHERLVAACRETDKSRPTEETELHIKKHRALCQSAFSSVEESLTASTAHRVMGVMRRDPFVRAFSKLPASQFQNLFDLTGHRPRLRGALTGAQKSHLGDVLFSMPNGHPDGAQSILRMELGISDDEAIELYLHWLVDKFNFAGWIASVHFTLSQVYLKRVTSVRLASICRQASAQEELVTWLCIMKFYLNTTSSKFEQSSDALIDVIEEAATIQSFSNHPAVPHATFDIESAKQLNLFVAVCAPYLARLGGTEIDGDFSWKGDVLAAADVVSEAIATSVPMLLYGFAMHLTRIRLAAEVTSDLISSYDTIVGVLNDLKKSFEPQPFVWVACRLYITNLLSAPLYHRFASHGQRRSDPTVRDLIGTAQRRHFASYVSTLVHELREASALIGDTSWPTTPVEAPLDKARFRGTTAADDFWLMQLGGADKEALSEQVVSAGVIAGMMNTLLHYDFPNGDGTVFCWSATKVDSLACFQHLQLGSPLAIAQPTTGDSERIREWIRSTAASTDAPNFSAFQTVSALFTLQPVDFVALLQLDRNLALGNDDTALTVDLPGVFSEEEANTIVLRHIQTRVAGKLKFLAASKHRRVEVSDLLVTIPSDVRAWISESPEVEPLPTLSRRTYELACVVSDDHDLRDGRPWLEFLPDVVAKLADSD